MNSEIKAIIDPKLYNAFLEFSKDDPILQSTLSKTNNLKEFVNALLASLICVIDREKSSYDMIKQILDSNPQIKSILEVKHDSSMLLEKESP
jgi:hypothetical protein